MRNMDWWLIFLFSLVESGCLAKKNKKCESVIAPLFRWNIFVWIRKPLNWSHRWEGCCIIFVWRYEEKRKLSLMKICFFFFFFFFFCNGRVGGGWKNEKARERLYVAVTWRSMNMQGSGVGLKRGWIIYNSIILVKRFEEQAEVGPFDELFFSLFPFVSEWRVRKRESTRAPLCRCDMAVYGYAR